ncbi:MAG: integrase [Nitrosopumilaceae archaeon]|nr:integrase [Nitrosopumilaceae archaeon]
MVLLSVPRFREVGMKLAVGEFERIEESDPLALYNQGIKAEETREKYTRMLRLVLCRLLEDILKGSFEERAGQLVRQGREDPMWARDLMLSISRKMRERTVLERDHPEYLNPASFPNYFNPVKKLLDMNDVMIPWKRIYSTFPPVENGSAPASRGWERAEISKMLRFCRGPVERAIILVCASSGIRTGGFPGLEWRDLEPVFRGPDGKLRMGDDDDDGSTRHEEETSGIACAKLQIYRGSPESYPAFITPEAYAALLDYRAEWAARVGRNPRPRDPVFIKSGDLPRRATPSMIMKHVRGAITRAGLRPSVLRAARGRTGYRYEIPMMNGFRRFWNKTCKESMSKESALSSLIKKEYMMGHVGLVNLDRNYFKAHVLELAEEYLQSVPALTIDDAERLRLDNERQSRRIGVMKDERDTEIAALKRTVEEMATRMENMVKGRDGPP